MDLLLQEALIADVSDCILLFCESPGSFCELGAFTALPTVRSILSVAVDKRYRGSGAEGFLAKGPVADLEKASPLSPWTNVFYVDPLCPVTTPDLTRYLLAFRSTVQSEPRKVSQRKPINNVTTGRGVYEVNVGSFVLELLDLVNVLSPICGRDLEEVYCRIKGSSRDKLRVLSPTIEDNFRQYDYRIGYESVLLFMRAMKMVRATERRGAEEDILSASFAPLIRLEDSFMFKGANDPDFKRMPKTRRASWRKCLSDGWTWHHTTGISTSAILLSSCHTCPSRCVESIALEQKSHQFLSRYRKSAGQLIEHPRPASARG